ncbi:MAG: UPF0147 family protein [Nanoarchaeota archaeon]|nr:UPF0147 family protein [Nanoarchaeota archaeon]
MTSSKFTGVLELIDELNDDSSIPKNVRSKLSEISESIKGGEDDSIKVHKSLNVLEEITEDSNLQAYTRTQIWNIVSLLESLDQ